MTDLISKQVAIEEIHKYFWEEIDKTPHELDEDGYDVYTDMGTVNSLLRHNKAISQRMKALQSAERHGEWKNDKCTQCGFEPLMRPFSLNLDTGERTLVLKYCPNCGVKMNNDDDWEEPEINPCRGCKDYDGCGGCKSHGGCGVERDEK